jgi:hypothetical protein
MSGKGNKGNKRFRSSTSVETEVLTDTESHMSEEEENLERTTDREFMADFMDKIDCNLDTILERLKESSLWQEQEKSMNSMYQDIEALKLENKDLKERLIHTEGRLTRAERKLEEADDRIIDLTSRSMRNNVIIKNIQETQGENVEEKIRSVFVEKLNIQNPERIEIERAHRVGKHIDGRIRNIVACLSSKGKATVMTHVKNLPKDDNIKILDQFPPEVNARRNKLWPQFIQAREAGIEARFNVDKLVVDKKVIDPPRDKVRDINLDVTGQSLTMKTKHTDVDSAKSSHLQGHAVPIKSADDIIPAVQALCADRRVAGSSHIMYAYRIGNEERYLSNYEDDGQWGAGNVIMNALVEKNCFNYLIAVTHWTGGRYVGSKLDMVKSLAGLAIDLFQ